MKNKRLNNLRKNCNIWVTCYFKNCAFGFDEDCAYFYCRTVEYYKKTTLFGKEKTKNETLYPMKSCKNGDLKDIDIFYKIISLQCSWIRRSFDNNFHDLEVIPLFLIKKVHHHHHHHHYYCFVLYYLFLKFCNIISILPLFISILRFLY